MKIIKKGIKEFTVSDTLYSRKVWFVPGPSHINHALCVFLDGEHYLDKIQAISQLEKLLTLNRLPQMSFAFVSHNGALARHEDYTCNDGFAKFIAIDLVRWARKQVGSINSDKNLICGISLSGLASAHIAVTYPKVFSSALCQSASFWWNNQKFPDFLSDKLLTTSKFWLSVGNKETNDKVSHPPTGMLQGVSQIQGVKSAFDGLKASRAKVRYNLYSGGHEFEPWIAEFSDAMEWLSGSDF